ncbi:23S rRNA pseudouridine(1911/1915/1917) synthase RluD [Candidatus Erwinia haradaeae]|uniref:Pseudouridine synthase n=1 Tax=Candidatus Erwinia haradaeae TaxID=1922217 RepID=A0A451D882_9GAMM|nr:23S rRNA pseudouridine(1911/1915/1917) synthase RluD [Candidatus Erwinia haradaeae]VFP82016.1 Ribosomal large subunit pseudouridine synthase D [Candidatus Erwinia haradaeae]
MSDKIELNASVPLDPIKNRLDQILVELFPIYSRSILKKWILCRCVTVNGVVVNIAKNKILGGEKICINVEIKKIDPWEAKEIPLHIVYEDQHILVIDKQSNLVVHPGAGHNHDTVLNALIHYFPAIKEVPRAGIVHRLDKDTTGLMVVAKTPLAHAHLVKALQERKITREYEAIVIGRMIAGGMVNSPISRHPTKRTHMAINHFGKPAITYYRILKKFRSHTWLKLQLYTGRTHQIRVHMAHIHHPLVGDPIYGGRPRLPKGASESFISTLYSFKRQALHASTLCLEHPIFGVQMKWNSKLPKDIAKLLSSLETDAKVYKELLDY